jgi:hypothetical protein
MLPGHDTWLSETQFPNVGTALRLFDRFYRQPRNLGLASVNVLAPGLAGEAAIHITTMRAFACLLIGIEAAGRIAGLDDGEKRGMGA